MAEERTRTFKSSDMPERCFNFFNDMRNNSELCDIIFQVGNESISAHRIIISAVIPYFRDLLSSNAAEREEEDISMPNMEPNAFRSLIEFAYSCEVEISAQNAKDLLAASCYLGVNEIREACCDFLADSLKPDTVLSVRHFACKVNCSELLRDIDCYVREKFSEICQTEDFLNYPSTYIMELLSQDDLNVGNEQTLFEAILQWVKKSPDDRITDFPELIRRIRMPLIDPAYLRSVVEKEEIIRTSMCCRDLLNEARIYNLLPRLWKSTCSFPIKPRQPFKITRASSKQKNSSICSLQVTPQHAMQHFDSLEEIISFILNSNAITEYDENVYFFNWDQLLKYESNTNRFQMLGEVPALRIYARAVCVRDKLYVCGGRSILISSKISSGAHNSVECFDLCKKIWIKVSSMRTARSSLSVAVLGGCIFVLGGRDHNYLHDSVERYNPIRDEWTTELPMLTKRSSASATTLDNRIYICGGMTSLAPHRYTASAEVYDPVAKNWTFITPLNDARWQFTLLSCEGKLYALGGRNAENQLMRTFDVYCPENDEWVSGPSSDNKRLSSDAVVVSSGSIKESTREHDGGISGCTTESGASTSAELSTEELFTSFSSRGSLSSSLFSWFSSSSLWKQEKKWWNTSCQM